MNSLPKWLVIVGGLVVVSGAFLFVDSWFPSTRDWVNGTVEQFRGEAPSEDHAADDGHDHGDDAHAGHNHAHDDATTLELSDKALRNLGLTRDYIKPVSLKTFRRSITVPAVVVERPGRTQIQVATPMTGVVTHVHAVPGTAVAPQTLLFEIRLTHEDLVKAQTDFLKTLGELDVERREIERLNEITKSGAVAGKILLEREYARDKLEAMLSAERESLRLHGLSSEQVDRIARERRLLRDLRIFVPLPDQHAEDEYQLTSEPIQQISFEQKTLEPKHDHEHGDTTFVLSDLRVHKGQSVHAGETLCVLSDYGELYIEGLAFEQDASLIAAASKKQWPVSALIERSKGQTERIPNLEIVRLGNEIDADSRTLKFYVRLQNHVQYDRTVADMTRYVEWVYRPGQRMQLVVPVEEWPDQIVLPIDAVTKEGAEYFAFQQNGDHFDRIPVHVKYRDQHSVVISNDGSLFPGDIVALRGAHQMQITIKNLQGGGVDAHHGHTH